MTHHHHDRTDSIRAPPKFQRCRNPRNGKGLHLEEAVVVSEQGLKSRILTQRGAKDGHFRQREQPSLMLLSPLCGSSSWHHQP